ncbi:MAG: hypothetical protein ACREVX_00310 [Clostridium sp.]|uniref:hypothetical protein n=1 Tax=Clostridium sp. TaxID=1506 RepID=UPI003D6D0525
MGIKTINIILFIAILLGIYTLIFRYRTKNKVIVKAKLINIEISKKKNKIVILIICSLMLVGPILLMLYSSLEEFHNTRVFRVEYGISFGELINDHKIELLVAKLEGDQKEWGEWSLETIKRSKIMLIYVINMICFIALFSKIGAIRVENEGIRNFIFLTPWNKYTGYFWKNNEITFLYAQNDKFIKLRIDYKDKAVLDQYLSGKINSIGK